ncbi:uncharacterized protein [Branchiostoma lanceolatum]|uniref:uncharacterized protein isoform X1 n=1 Tax=Branchiostoma lanceolatum TaxID=7740 RepID=UPI0034572E34
MAELVLFQGCGRFIADYAGVCNSPENKDWCWQICWPGFGVEEEDCGDSVQDSCEGDHQVGGGGLQWCHCLWRVVVGLLLTTLVFVTVRRTRIGVGRSVGQALELKKRIVVIVYRTAVRETIK